MISYLILDKSAQILSMIFGTILSGAIVYIIHFFKLTLDYSGVEYTQFEDDVYYYYVKAVPKIAVTTPQINVKHINVKNAEQGSKAEAKNHNMDYEDDLDEEDDSYSENNDTYDFSDASKPSGRNGRDE